MRCDRLGLAGLLDHEKLGQDGHGLQVDGERPQDLHHAELVVQDERQNHAGPEEELNPANRGFLSSVMTRINVKSYLNVS